MNNTKPLVDRIGKKNITKEGYIIEIINYTNCDNIVVRLDNKINKKTTYGKFKSGGIKNPYHKTIANVGFYGVGKYKAFENNKKNINYAIWQAMIKRCYLESERKKYPTYVNCTVCEEWHNFQNFAQWHKENYRKFDNIIFHLDKDLLCGKKNNKIYSPDTCAYIPSNINKLLNIRQNHRGKYPIGVQWNVKANKFEASFTKNNKRFYIGVFSTKEEAFFAYKKEKEKFIKETAKYYKNIIPVKIFDALINYKVEIND